MKNGTIKPASDFYTTYRVEIDGVFPKDEHVFVPICVQFVDADKQLDDKWLECGGLVMLHDSAKQSMRAELILVQYKKATPVAVSEVRTLGFPLNFDVPPEDAKEYENWAVQAGKTCTDIIDNLLMTPNKADWALVGNIKNAKVMFLEVPEQPKPTNIGVWTEIAKQGDNND